MEFKSYLRLRVYTGEYDRVENMAAYEFIVKAAHDARLLGATVFRGSMGFGADTVIHTPKILRLVEDLPIIVEIVDFPDKITQFCDTVLTKLEKGLVTREPVEAASLSQCARP